MGSQQNEIILKVWTQGLSYENSSPPRVGLESPKVEKYIILY